MIDVPMTADEQIDSKLTELMDYDWAKMGDPKRKQAYKLAAKKDILDLMRQEMFIARVDEATRAAGSWEKKPGIPATYLIDRIEELKADIADLTPASFIA